MARLQRAARYQLNVAGEWLQLGKKSGVEPAFAFVAAYSAVNALYWLWSSIDAAEQNSRYGEQSKRRGELKLVGDEPDQLGRLIERLGEHAAEALLNDKEVLKATRFLNGREHGIRDMRFREAAEEGSPSKGSELRDKLNDPGVSAVARLQAFAGILYLVRCNLVHGSKQVAGTGPDHDLLSALAPALRRVAEVARAFTDTQFQ